MFDLARQTDAIRLPLMGGDPRLAVSTDVGEAASGSEFVRENADPVSVEYRTRFSIVSSRQLARRPSEGDALQDRLVSTMAERIRPVAEHSGQAASLALVLVQRGKDKEALDLLEPFSRFASEYWVDHYRALALHHLGDIPSAKRVLEQLMQRFPGDVRPVHALGRLLLDQQDWAEAASTLNRACCLREATAVTFSDWAMACMALGDERTALGALRSALKLDSACTLALNNMAVLLWGRNQQDKAVSYLQAALRIDPSFLPAVHNLSDCLISRHDFATAIHVLETYMENSPDDVPSLERLAWAHYGIGSNAQALALLKKALSYSGGKNPSVLNNLGIVAGQHGDARLAEESFRKALNNAPQSVRTRVNFAVFYASQRRWQDVVDLLNSHLPEDGEPGGWMVLTSAMAFLGRGREMLHPLQHLHDRWPEDLRITTMLGHVYCSVLGDAEAAIAMLRPVYESGRADDMIANNLAYAFIKAGDHQSARKILAPMISRLPEIPVGARTCVRATWGLLLLREGSYLEGIEAYQRSLAEASGLLAERIRQKIAVEQARHFFRHGNEAAAKRHLQRALELDVDPEFTNEARQLIESYAGPN